MQDILIYAAPAVTLGLGYFAGRLSVRQSPAHSTLNFGDGIDWKDVAILRFDQVMEGARQCEALEASLNDAIGSQIRLTDALTAKNERLERIAAQETTGANATVKRMAAIARGDA